ncbi:hypothetical protein ASF41_10485 [Methylobacterium sp. Leaf111]|nr:hypothetical protein ASF41_10485 [Methylobacterium sp. Leaf111]
MSVSENLRTEAEVAAELKCSVAKIRKLRAAGRLAFIPGRPVLILDRDFVKLQREEAEIAYARWEKRKRKKRGTKPPNPNEDLDAPERRRVRLMWLKHRGPAVLRHLAKPTR